MIGLSVGAEAAVSVAQEPLCGHMALAEITRVHRRRAWRCPQLASEARYAAGQLGNVARRLLLGETLPPFVGNLDLEELVPST